MSHGIAVQKDSSPPQTTVPVVVVDDGNPLAEELVRFWGANASLLRLSSELSSLCPASTGELVLFLPGSHGAMRRNDLDETIRQLRRLKPHHICCITGCQSLMKRLDGKRVGAPEDEIRNALGDTTRVSVLQTGFAVTPASLISRWARNLAWIQPLLTDSIRSTFVAVPELVAAVDDIMSSSTSGGSRVMTLLGRNQAWRDVIPEAEALLGRSGLTHILLPICRVLRYGGVGLLFRAVIEVLIRCRPEWKVLCFDTLTPHSEKELISLCNRHNIRHLAVCGYNNGVNHFGWTYRDRTVVPTIQSGSTIDISENHVVVDAGIVLKDCISALAVAGKELYVVPNYSYISMGTTFFVPVHGSGTEVTTLGDTIDYIRLYDPITDEIIESARGEKLFLDTMYNMQSGYVLLQLRLRIREKADYFMQQSELACPSADKVWNLFDDPQTSNIELRKPRAADDSVQVTKYYTTATPGTQRLLVPRDTTGSLWDRLEGNRVTAYLFHLLVRRLFFHVELFLRVGEFHEFWDRHRQLPVSKIQLRIVQHDNIPHSPFCDENCVSVDLIMRRRHRAVFLKFIKEHIPDVRVNPGKHSM